MGRGRRIGEPRLVGRERGRGAVRAGLRTPGALDEGGVRNIMDDEQASRSSRHQPLDRVRDAQRAVQQREREHRAAVEETLNEIAEEFEHDIAEQAESRDPADPRSASRRAPPNEPVA
jgi:hypothetical protein